MPITDRPGLWKVIGLDTAALLMTAFMVIGDNSLDYFILLFLAVVGQAFLLTPRAFWPRLAGALLVSELALFKAGDVAWLDTFEPLAMALLTTLVFVMHTGREKVRAQLRDQAAHDPLTSLFNRRAMQAQFETAVGELHRRSTPFAVFYIDLDGFKAVNDTYGHEVGDLLLTTVARRIEQVTRSEDTVGRLGGDEFTLLLRSATGPKQIEDVARRLVRQLAAPFLIGGQSITISASVGVAVTSATHPRTAEDLLGDADRAMYSVKRGRKGAYAIMPVA